MSALRKIEGLEEAAKAISVEMRGTIFHQKNGKARFTPRKKPLTTLERTKLAIALLKLTENYDKSRLNIHFNCQCTSIDFAAKKLKLQLETQEDFTIDYDL